MTTTPPPEAIRIDRLAWSGHGCATIDGRTVRVARVDVGERVVVSAPERGRARLVEVVEPSPHRVDPRCAQFDDCPGCPLRMLSADRIRAHAERLHRAALARIAGVDGPWVRLPSTAGDGSRVKAVARALRGEDGQLVLGMAGGGRPAVRLGACPLQSDRCRALVAAVERDLRAAGVEPWDPSTRRGTLRHVIVHAIGDAARVIIAHDAQRPVPTDGLLIDTPAVSILTDALPRRGAGLLHRPAPVRGDGVLRFELDGDRFGAGPRAWVPQTPSTVPALRRVVVEWLAPRASDEIVEIGCGIGLLSLPLARRAAGLCGVDIERQAALDATANAALNGVANARFRTGEATHALRRLLAGGARADGVLLHAMRRPFGEAAMRGVAALGPRRVLYLAPHAPSLARDLVHLTEYEVIRLGLLDQTPGVVGNLTLALLTRRSGSGGS